jgi:hypothetical protein
VNKTHPLGHLIQFASDKAYERAIEALLRVPVPRCGFPDRRMLVTSAHLEVLDEAQIPYKNLSTPDSPNGNQIP